MRTTLVAGILAASLIAGCSAPNTPSTPEVNASPAVDPFLPTEVAGISLGLATAAPAYYASPPPVPPDATSPDVWVTILSGIGKSWADLRFVGKAESETEGLGIYATQLRGAVSPEAFLGAYEDAMGTTDSRQKVTFEHRTAAGREVLVSTIGVLYVYAVDGVLHEISAPSAALAEQALATLP